MKTHPLLRALFAALICLFVSLVSVSAQPSITVGSTLGPNSSTSQNAWIQNVYAAFASGQPSISVGTPNLPTFYEEAPVTISIYSLASSQNFGMWNGGLLTTQSLGAAFSSENGERLFFPLLINGNGTSISLNQLSRSITAVNPGGTAALQLQTFSTQSSYTNLTFGILFGTDHAFGGTGTAADTFLTSGAATQVVDAIFAIGVNARLFVSGGTSGSAPATITANQALVDGVINGNDDLSSITAMYSFTGAWGTINASDTQLMGLTSIPEPMTYMRIFMLVCLTVLLFRRTRVTAA